jgi:hypothetical protein
VQVGPDARFMSLIKLAAYRAFWNVGMTGLRAVANILRLSHLLTPGMDLFTMLWILIHAMLGLNDAEIMNILALRLGSMHVSHYASCDELLDFDEAVAMLGKEHRQEIRAEKKTCQCD